MAAVAPNKPIWCTFAAAAAIAAAADDASSTTSFCFGAHNWSRFEKKRKNRRTFKLILWEPLVLASLLACIPVMLARERDPIRSGHKIRKNNNHYHPNTRASFVQIVVYRERARAFANWIVLACFALRPFHFVQLLLLQQK